MSPSSRKPKPSTRNCSDSLPHIVSLVGEINLGDTYYFARRTLLSILQTDVPHEVR
jgi:hypothetical protein